MTPRQLIRPWVGLRPTTPQYAAGRSVEPTVCDPRASGIMRAATAAAEPLDEPPGGCAGFQGLHVSAGSWKANSVALVLPRMMAPARRRRATLVASSDGRSCANTP